MELNFVMMFGLAIVIMVVLSFLYFAIRASYAYHDIGSNMVKIVEGSLISGIGLGVMLGFMFWCVLPTHYYVTGSGQNDNYTRYVLDGSFTQEYGRKYIVNLSKESYYYVAMTYGNAELDKDESPINEIKAGYIVEIKHDIDEWFKEFPDQVSTKNSGETKWHVLTAEQTAAELNAAGVNE